MTEQVTGAIKHAVMGHKNDKIDQLKANTVEPNENSRITSDYGVKQNNTDHWLRVASEDQTGPSLLEDAFGREKVCHQNRALYLDLILTFHQRSTDLTTSASPSALSMPVVLAPTVPLDSSSQLPMLQRLVSLPTHLERHLFLFVSQLFLEAVALPTLSAMFVVSPSSFTPKKVRQHQILPPNQCPTPIYYPLSSILYSES